MRVVEIIIDGFKSYAVRTVITGWDESFNSITGLNGSGKSNILDAICFVLGITNMTTMRAQNLQDLIYKRGQAGVTKASVTIVFDNSDKSKSPINYQSFPQISVTRQIVMGGTSKYLINGSRTQQQVVQTLFQSVGLNINNPNFLIMQGRITKVLNMKHTEILSMIEEAAGTRMFEDRKDKAQKTMAKKDKKVEEINDLLREEIEPKLEKLRIEKRVFLDFQQTQNDLERLQKIVVAHDFVKFTQKVEQSAADLEAKKQRVIELDVSAERLKHEIEVLAEDVKRVKAQRDKELREGGRFQELEEEVKEAEHAIVRLNTNIELKKAGEKEEKDKRKAAEKALKEMEKHLTEKTQHYEQLKEGYDAAKAEFDALSEEAEKKEELLQTLLTGVASKEGQESGYQNQLQEARNKASAAATEQEQAKLKITHLEKRIKEEEPRAKKAKQQNQTLFQDLDKLRTATEQLKTDMARMGYEEGKEEEARREEAMLNEQIRELRAQADQLRRRVANIDFNYTSPSPNFDRRRVKGLVAQLFTLDKDKSMAGTALEICAGGRLYNVVVDTAETGSELLQKGRLRKRVTIIPLNKIQTFRAAAEKVATAQRLAPNKVELALSLIGYDHEVSAAMEFVFGSTFICEDAATAKKVTFDPNVRMRSVTFDGDVYDPSGTLSGGSAPNSSGVLVTMQKLNYLNKDIEEKTDRLNIIRETMAREKAKLDAVRKLKQDLELKNHEIALTEEQINSNSSSNIIQAVEDMKEQVTQLKQTIVDAKQRQSEATAEAKKVEKDINDFKNNKDSKLAELQKTVDQLKKRVIKSTTSLKALQKDFQTAQLETEQAGGDLAAAQEALTDVSASLTEIASEIQELEKQKSLTKDTHDLALAQLQDERAKLSGFDNELSELDAASRAKQARIGEEALEKQKLGHEVERFQKDQQTAKESVTRMLRDYEWIEDEQDQFGRPGTPYDYADENIQQCRTKLHRLQEQFTGMKKKINPKVMNMIDSVEKKEAGLKKMLNTVIKDKRKIEETIVELERYKKEALEKTHVKVSKDFGNIFAELLPGSFAKLVPAEDKNGVREVSHGLEVKVQLGKVWKESLTELSGGQRSLIALSLIMALLQFKPAPMYILDEVDAALDLSHTQNIGRLIKTRFKGSQFIVVSLKDGMFQNANRIFRTRFVDGTSVVQVL